MLILADRDVHFCMPRSRQKDRSLTGQPFQALVPPVVRTDIREGFEPSDPRRGRPFTGGLNRSPTGCPIITGARDEFHSFVALSLPGISREAEQAGQDLLRALPARAV
jgi:hypothetical protein